MSDRKRIAAVLTTFFEHSHADVILSKFIRGFPTNAGTLEPQVSVASIYLDQIHEEDLCLPLAREAGIPVYPSITRALTLGGDELAVDGVLIVGEHGDYAWNELGQHMYPRHYFFEQVCGVCAAAKRPVPVFSDKHLSWNWEQSKWMYDRAVQLKIPFMAGSSVPLSYRNPWIEYELDTPLEEALTMAYGDLDSYGFHALELLQCMVERRSGGESGIVAVQCLEGDVVWSAADRGLWSRELARAAEEHIEPRAPGAMEDNCRNPALLALEYADGLRASTLMLNGHLRGWGYAGRVSGEIRGMETYLSGNPHPHFSYLGLNIQEFFLHGRPPYPIERTLLVSGALEALAQSRYRGHIRVETPHLNIRYRSYETRPVRPTDPRPVGAATIPW